MKKTKILSITAAALLLFSLSACDNQEVTEDDETSAEGLGSNESITEGFTNTTDELNEISDQQSQRVEDTQEYLGDDW